MSPTEPPAPTRSAAPPGAPAPGSERAPAPALIVVIPIFNEAATVADVVARARAHAPVLVVDDGSSDDGAARAAAAGAEVIRHPRRLGRGQAIRTGMATAAIRGATAIVTLDGDGQHDPADIPALRAAADARPATLVVGSRFGRAGAAAGERPTVARVIGERSQAARVGGERRNAARVAGFFVNWATGCRLEDPQSGYRLYPLALARDLPTRRGGIAFETELLVAAARLRLAVHEVPVDVRPRQEAVDARPRRAGRLRSAADGARLAAYLATLGIARWRAELGAGLTAVTAVVSRERRAARHADMLLEASVYADAPGMWAAALGAGAGRHAVDRLVAWWRHPRRRRATAVAGGMLLLPVVGGLGLCQWLLDRCGAGTLDVMTPVVDRWFAQDRLAALDPGDAPVAPGPRQTVALVAPPALPS